MPCEFSEKDRLEERDLYRSTERLAYARFTKSEILSLIIDADVKNDHVLINEAVHGDLGTFSITVNSTNRTVSSRLPCPESCQENLNKQVTFPVQACLNHIVEIASHPQGEQLAIHFNADLTALVIYPVDVASDGKFTPILYNDDFNARTVE